MHRALALQSLGKLGNDRVYAKFAQKEEVTGLPTTGVGGFYNIMDAVAQLKSAGFGFGAPGSKPGTAYTYDDVSTRTPTGEHHQPLVAPRSSGPAAAASRRWSVLSGYAGGQRGCECCLVVNSGCWREPSNLGSRQAYALQELSTRLRATRAHHH